MPLSRPLRRRLRAATVGPALALTAALGGAGLAPAPASAGILTGAQEIAFLNAQRSANGIPGDITEVPDWSAGCAAHMAYLKATKTFAHTEDPTSPYYTAAGAQAGGTSVLTSGGSSFSATGVNAFEHAPIHLMQMLDPFMQRSGAADGCLTTLGDIDRVFPTAQTFSYPGDGATVPPSETTYEGPFVPAAFVGLNVPGNVTRSVVAGPSLYFFYAAAGDYGYGNSTGQITAASLTSPAGPVAVKWVDNSTTDPTLGDLGPYLAPGGIVIPVAPLTNDTTYTASVTFQPSSGGALPVQRTWTIKTGTGTPPATPAPTPAPSPGPTATQADADAATLKPGSITSLAVGARALTLKAKAAGTLWVTVERQAGPARHRRWVRTQSFGANAAAAGRVQVKLAKKLGTGRFRVTLRSGSSTGKVLARRTVRRR